MALHKDHGLRADNLYSWTSGGYLHERAHGRLSPAGACKNGDRNPPLLALCGARIGPHWVDKPVRRVPKWWQSTRITRGDGRSQVTLSLGHSYQPSVNCHAVVSRALPNPCGIHRVCSSRTYHT
jgi:hypothetical protein